MYVLRSRDIVYPLRNMDSMFCVGLKRISELMKKKSWFRWPVDDLCVGTKCWLCTLRLLVDYTSVEMLLATVALRQRA